MTIASYAVINTRPGDCASDPFCPPAEFKGTNRDYYLLLVERYKSNIEWRQRMVLTARHSLKSRNTVHNGIDVRGPFVREAKHFIAKLAASLQAQHASAQSA